MLRVRLPVLKSWPLTLAFAALCVAALACSGLGGGARGGEPGGNGGGGTNGEGTAVTLVNTGQGSVCFVYISPSSQEAWGEDKLGSDVISPEASQTFPVVPNETYDLRADDCNHITLDEERDVTLNPGDVYRWEVKSLAASEIGTVTLANAGGASVCFVYISPSTSDGWGGDLLGREETVAPGAQRVFELPGGVEYDLRADDCDGNTIGDPDNPPKVTVSTGVNVPWEVRP